MFRNIVGFVVLILTIISCTTTSPLKKEEIDSVLMNKKALVLIKFSTFSDAIFGGLLNHTTNTTWINKYNSHRNLETKSLSWNSEQQMEVYIIEPGIYSMRTFEIDRYSQVSYKLDGIYNFAKFHIKGGNVLYLGNIVTNLGDIRSDIKRFFPNKILIKDNYDIVQREFKISYPELYSRLIKNLVILNK